MGELMEETKVREITLSDAEKIIQLQESHFYDIKSKDISGKALQKIVVAFANADGGECYIGIADEKEVIKLNLRNPIERWIGFKNQEEANQLIQTIFQDIKPLPPVEFEFYVISGQEERGLVLYLNIIKSADMHYTAEKKAYARKNAQKLPVEGEDIVNLKLSKGLLSYEDQLLSSITAEELSLSDELSIFLREYSPSMEPSIFLKKQRLIRMENNELLPTVAGTLLYADLPSAILPKKCSVKVVYYDTSEAEPAREHLKETHTIEGPLRIQINSSLAKIEEIIENIPILTEGKFEKPKYPIDAIKEILVNALIHRNYNISDDVLVFIFNNRIEIKNPGRLPGHITEQNILEERFARNPMIVRLLNKYPDPPNKDIGEGLNTAFEKMHEMNLKNPQFIISDNYVKVILPHEPLASPEATIMEYLMKNAEVNNSTARVLTGIKSENTMKNLFYKLRDNGLIERVPNKNGSASSWRAVKNK